MVLLLITQVTLNALAFLLSATEGSVALSKSVAGVSHIWYRTGHWFLKLSLRVPR